LWILANNGGKMKRSRLRYCNRDAICITEPYPWELVREGKIKVIIGIREIHAARNKMEQ
jgi:hypothetical protein